MAVSHVFTNAVADATGTMTIWYGATTVTVAATDVVRPSDWNSAHYQFMSATGNTAGQSTFSGTNIVFGGGPNVTLSGVNATRIDISAAAGGGGAVVSNAIQSVGSATGSGTNTSRFAADDHVHAGVFSVGVSNVGNTAGDTRVDVGRFVLAGGANVTLSQATAANALNTVSIVGPTQTNQTGGIYVTAQSTGQSSSSTYDVRTLSFVPDGIISAGWSNGSFRVSATQSNQNVTAGNGGFAFQTLSFSNANGVSFGTSAGSAITASYTRNAASNAIQSVGSATGSGTNTSRFAADDHVHAGVFSVGVSNVGNTAGDTRVDVGRFVLAGGNAVTLSQATAANALNTVSVVGLNQAFSAAGGSSSFQTLGFSDNAYASWTNSNGSVALTELRASFFATSNTTQSSSGTQNIDAITFAGAGIASVGVTNGSIVISVPAGGGGGDGGVFAGVSTGGNTAGSTGTVSTGNFVLVGSNGITLSQSTAAAGSHATVTINGGRSIWNGTEFQPPSLPRTAQTQVSLGQNSLYIWPVRVQESVTGNAGHMYVTISHGSSAASSGRRGLTMEFGIYTRHSTNSTVLTQHYSTSYTAAASYSSNVSMAFSFITQVSNSTSYGTLSSSSAGLNISTQIINDRHLIFPFSTLMTPGDYWFGIRQSSSSAGTVGNCLLLSHYCRQVSIGTALGQASSNATTNRWAVETMWGTYSATTGAMPGGISQTQIQNGANGSFAAPVIRLLEYTA